MIILIFIISFVAWLLASYRIIFLSKPPTNLFKASVLSFLEEIFGILTIGLVVISHLNAWYVLSAGLGAFCGMMFDIEEFIKLIKRRVRK